MKYLTGRRRTKLGLNRSDDKWTCDICGRVIYGKRNTIHLGIQSHAKAWHIGEIKTKYGEATNGN